MTPKHLLSGLLFVLIAVAAEATTVTATKDCLLGPPCTMTRANFSITVAQIIEWQAMYTGTSTQGHSFYLHRPGGWLNEIELTKTGVLAGKHYLASGTYQISIEYFAMGPGTYSVTYNASSSGEPHIRTIDGVHYDFQGAGEFVLLRNSPDVEIQTRQTPIAASYLPGPDPYDGLAVCVGMNTAVAARLGTHRVTYEPNLSGVPDPTGLQLRVDGVLTTLGRTGLDLGNGGRITRTAAPGGIEIGFPDKTVLFVTPGWWDSQSAWYLNYDVVPSREGGGLAGAIGAQSWLPALPDGTTVGTMPRDPHDRYVALYQTFAEAWRITPTTSLFDYAPGTSTDTFTMRNWPPEHPPCTLPGKVPVNPASELVAIEACKGVLGESARNDCVYDVIVTGDPGFAATYTRSQSLQPSSVAPMPKKIAAFADFGVGMPRGTFGNSFDRGWSFNAGLEYLITSRVSAETILGHHRFPDVISGHADIRQLSANAKVYLIPPPYKFLPFVHGGGGAYKFSSGSSEFGTNLGAGVLYELNARFAVQGRYDFHNIDTGGTTTRFSTLQVGVWFLF